MRLLTNGINPLLFRIEMNKETVIPAKAGKRVI